MPDETEHESPHLPLGEPAESADPAHDAGAAHDPEAGHELPADGTGDLITLDDAPPGDQPPSERPPAEPAPPLLLLIAAGVIAALLLAVYLDLGALARGRAAVTAANERVRKAESDMAAAQTDLAKLKALPPVHNGCTDLADYVDAPSMRRLNLHGEGAGKSADANYYLPLHGEGCVVITGSLPAGVPVLWQITSVAHKLAALPRSGEPRTAPASLESGKGTLVITMEKSADVKSPGAAPILIGKVE
jgi:hypothetical protein